MLSTFQIVINVFLALVLFPIVVRSLLTGSEAPNGPIAKYYAAVPYLARTGDLMLIALCLLSIVSLAGHFGVIRTDAASSLIFWIDKPFLLILVVYLSLWGLALWKVHGSGRRAIRERE